MQKIDFILEIYLQLLIHLYYIKLEMDGKGMLIVVHLMQFTLERPQRVSTLISTSIVKEEEIATLSSDTEKITRYIG